MDITAKFQESFHSYRKDEERMGKGLKFVYDLKTADVLVYTEEWDCYDGYDSYGSPYYWSFSERWENISLFEFAKLMEFYLEFKRSFDNDGINCFFVMDGDE